MSAILILFIQLLYAIGIVLLPCEISRPCKPYAMFMKQVDLSPSILFLPLNLLELPGSAAGVTAKICGVFTTERPKQH